MKHTLQHAACVLDFATLHTCSSTLGSRVNACPSGVYHYSTTPVPSVNATSYLIYLSLSTRDENANNVGGGDTFGVSIQPCQVPLS